MAYSDKLLDHYENPRNVGTLNKDESDVGTGLVGVATFPIVLRTSPPSISVLATAASMLSRHKTYQDNTR